MALLENPVSNLLLGLASLRQPELLGQVQQQKNLAAKQRQQAPILRQQQELRDIQLQQARQQMQQQQQQQQALQKAGGLLGMQVPGAALPLAQRQQMAGGALLEAGMPKEGLSLLQPKPQAGFTLSPGQTRYEGGQPIASAPSLEKETKADYEQEKMTFQQEKDLRTVFNKETQPFVEVNNAFGRISASAKNPSPAGDMALIFNFMKMLDPGSTVREGEYANAQNAGSAPSKLRALYNSVVDGTRLDTTQRADFVDRAGRLYAQSSNTYEQRAKQYKELATSYNLDPDKVVLDRKLFKDIMPPPLPGKFKRQIR